LNPCTLARNHQGGQKARNSSHRAHRENQSFDVFLKVSVISVAIFMLLGGFNTVPAFGAGVERLRTALLKLKVSGG